MTKLILAGLCLSLAACGKIVPFESGDGGTVSDGSTGGDAGNGADASTSAACESPIAFEDLSGCLLEAQCAQFVRCSPIFLDLDECRANLSKVLGDFDAQLLVFEHAISAGKANYDPVAAFTCLESLAAGSCSSNGGDEQCDPVFRGITAPGGACLEEFECSAPGSNCDQSQCDGSVQCCTGFCASPVDVGQSCNFDRCKPSDHCVRLGAGTNDFVCQPGDINSPCDGSSFNCDSGFFCAPIQNVCVPTNATGADCLTQDECSGDNDCVNGTCKSVDTVGDLCQNSCLGGLTCENGTCAALPGLGDDCSASGQCNSVTLDCFGGVGPRVCVAKQELGELCSPRQCQPGLVCQADLPLPPPIATCIMPLPDGSACERDQQCASSQCQFAVQGNQGTCVEPLDCYATTSF